MVAIPHSSPTFAFDANLKTSLRLIECILKGIAYLKTAKSHGFLLMQISYPYIFGNNVPKIQENRASSF